MYSNEMEVEKDLRKRETGYVNSIKPCHVVP
jgi:hypothetical protein